MRKTGFCVSGGAVIVAMTSFAADAWAQRPPAAPPPPPPPTIIIVQQQAQSTPMSNPGLVAGGGVLIGLGGVGMLIGIPITIWGASIANSCAESFDPTTHTFVCNGSGRAGTLAGGIVTDLLSAGMIAGGIAMVVIGLKPPEAPPTDPRVQTALVPTLKLGPGSAVLDVSF
jgi:hypothetical protein